MKIASNSMVAAAGTAIALTPAWVWAQQRRCRALAASADSYVGRVSGGCHLDRKMDDLIHSAGFELTELRNEYAEGPRIMTYMYEGCAMPAA